MKTQQQPDWHGPLIERYEVACVAAAELIRKARHSDQNKRDELYGELLRLDDERQDIRRQLYYANCPVTGQ